MRKKCRWAAKAGTYARERPCAKPALRTTKAVPACMHHAHEYDRTKTVRRYEEARP